LFANDSVGLANHPVRPSWRAHAADDDCAADDDASLDDDDDDVQKRNRMIRGQYERRDSLVKAVVVNPWR